MLQRADADTATLARLASTHHRRHLSGLVFVMLAAALWATVGVASQLIPHDTAIPQEAYGFARTAVAGPILLLCAFVAGGRASVLPRTGSFSAFLTFGLCCAVFQVGLFRSFGLIGVTVTVFITVCLPPVIAVAWTMLRQPALVSRGVLAALLMALAGLASFSGSGFGGGGLAQTMAGLALSVIASVAFVVMSSAARSLAADHAPLLVAGLGLTLASLFLAPAVSAFTPGGWASLAAAIGEWRTGSFLLYLGLIPTALAYLLYCSGMARCRTAACGLVASMIEPGVAAALALLLLHEYLSVWEILGCAMLFLGMLTLWREEQQARR
jgi:DME family drug/metabolite transporter